MTLSLSAADFFAAKLAFEIDPSDLAADRAARYRTARHRHPVGRILEPGPASPGAVHIPNAELEGRIADLAPDKGTPIVVYCWGPGCKRGVTRGALTLATPRLLERA